MAAAAEGLCREPIARVQHANQPRCTTRATRLRGGHGAATHPSKQLTRKRQVQLPSTSLLGCPLLDIGSRPAWWCNWLNVISRGGGGCEVHSDAMRRGWQ